MVTQRVILTSVTAVDVSDILGIYGLGVFSCFFSTARTDNRVCRK